jgi:hypothetical protein
MFPPPSTISLAPSTITTYSQQFTIPFRSSNLHDFSFLQLTGIACFRSTKTNLMIRKCLLENLTGFVVPLLIAESGCYDTAIRRVEVNV